MYRAVFGTYCHIIALCLDPQYGSNEVVGKLGGVGGRKGEDEPGTNFSAIDRPGLTGFSFKSGQLGGRYERKRRTWNEPQEGKTNPERLIDGEGRLNEPPEVFNEGDNKSHKAIRTFC